MPSSTGPQARRRGPIPSSTILRWSAARRGLVGLAGAIALEGLLLAPVSAEPFGAASPADEAQAPVQTSKATVFAIRNVASGRCLRRAREPGILWDGSVLGRYGAETEDCAASDGDPRQRFLVRDVESGQLVRALEPRRGYTFHPEDAPFDLCLHAAGGVPFRFQRCDGSRAQQFALDVDAAGAARVVPRHNPYTGCMNDLLFGDDVAGAPCPAWQALSTLRWSFEPRGTRPMARVAGLGGDPYWLDRLGREGVDLSAPSTQPLASIAARVREPRGIVYRQRVVDNRTGEPAVSWEACPLDADAKPIVGVDGRALVCAFTDEEGYYTIVGLPPDADVMMATGRRGYLASAILFRTTYEGWFVQEYTGTAALAAAALGLNIDARHRFTSGFGVRPGLGDASLTVLDERDPVGSRGYGVTEEGDYVGTGTDGATFHV